MNCEEVEELAGAYALWALPQDTLQEVEAHLASCSAHPDIPGLRAAALCLAWAAPEKEPPAALKARLMGVIRGEATEEKRVRMRLPPFRRWPRFAPQAMVALLVAAVGLLTWNIALQLSEDRGQDITFVRTLRDGGTASGRILYIQEQGIALLTVAGLAPLTEDKTYQVWATGEGDPVSIGLFATSRAAEGSVVLRADLSQAKGIAITVEPAGGSPQPTTEPILTAKI